VSGPHRLQALIFLDLRLSDYQARVGLRRCAVSIAPLCCLSLLPLLPLSAASIAPLCCLHCPSLLPLLPLSAASIAPLCCLYCPSLLPLLPLSAPPDRRS